MKLKEAKEITGYILEWQFVQMGIKEHKDIELFDISKYSLSDLLKANSMIVANNKRKMKMNKYHQDKGHKVKSYSISMTLADRLIAAVYTAKNFKPNGEMVAIIDGIGVGCVKVKYK